MPTYAPFNFPFDGQIPKEIFEDSDDEFADIKNMSDEELRAVIYAWLYKETMEQESN